MMARKSGEGHYTGRDKGDLGVRDYERSDPPKRDVSDKAERAADVKGGYSGPASRGKGC